MRKHNLKALYGKAISSEATYRFITIFINCLADGIEGRFFYIHNDAKPNQQQVLEKRNTIQCDLRKTEYSIQ